LQWRIQRTKSVRTYRAYAMYQMDKNIAEKHVVTLEATMWKLHVNATIWHARSRFRDSRLEVPLT
jgi:nucleoside-specific outer membrane channel protein Tsx